METLSVDRSLALLIAHDGRTVRRPLGILQISRLLFRREHRVLVEIGLHLPDENDYEKACRNKESQVYSGCLEVAFDSIVSDAAQPPPEGYPVGSRACEIPEQCRNEFHLPCRDIARKAHGDKGIDRYEDLVGKLDPVLELGCYRVESDLHQRAEHEDQHVYDDA